MNVLKLPILLLAVFLICSMAMGQTTLSIPSGLDIELGGEVELEFIDVEGAGGFANQDLTFKKVDNRSPYMRIDKAVLATRVNYSDNLYYHIEFRFDDDKAKVDKNYARLFAPGINTRFEMGKNRPFIAASRHTEGYPLIGTAFWKGREVHINGVTALPFGDNGELTGGLSVAMKRPFDTDDAAEDESFKMLVYGDYDVKDGQTFEYGFMGGLRFGSLHAEGWYFMGELIDDWDWKLMLKQSLEPYASRGDETDRTHYWYGGRLSFDLEGLHARTEYIYGKDGLLPRSGYYGELGYRFDASTFLPVKSLEPIGRIGSLQLNALDASDGSSLEWAYLGEPMSWNRMMTTMGLLVEVNDYLTIKAEYYLLEEDTGDDSQKGVDDNQGMIQINFAF